MHFLGVAGMPRRIPGEQFVFIFTNKDYRKDFAKFGSPNLRLDFYTFIQRSLKISKFMLSKGRLFGQCTKIGYKLLCLGFLPF